jgi:hypothetical protein
LCIFVCIHCLTVELINCILKRRVYRYVYISFVYIYIYIHKHICICIYMYVCIYLSFVYMYIWNLCIHNACVYCSLSIFACIIIYEYIQVTHCLVINYLTKHHQYIQVPPSPIGSIPTIYEYIHMYTRIHYTYIYTYTRMFI